MYKGLSIHIDPVSGLGIPTDYATEFPKADVILVTHEHGDHFDRVALEALGANGNNRPVGDDTQRRRQHSPVYLSGSAHDSGAFSAFQCVTKSGKFRLI